VRIGHFLAHFPDPGGTTTMVVGLSSALVRLGHPAFIYGYGGRSSASTGTRAEVCVKVASSGIVPRVFRSPFVTAPLPAQVPGGIT
jgi:hypothetical protein